MITIILQGGLGNQMLQYGFGLQTAKRLNTELQIDVTPLLYDKIRQYNLSLFSGVKETITTKTKPTVKERGLPYNQELVDSIVDGDAILGYWPTEKYFPDIKQDLFERFQPRQGMPDKAVETAMKIARAHKRSTMLTIRRTDYVTKQDFHGVLPMDYYNRALDVVAKNLNDAPEIFVFSDEPEWCKQNLSFAYPHEVVGTDDMTTALHMGREDVDLYLMSKCQNAVTANSSFSWWGAWLGEQRGNKGTITAPKQWFTTNTVDWKDIVPDRWVKL